MGKWIAPENTQTTLVTKNPCFLYCINADNDDTGDYMKHDDNLKGNADKAMRVGWLSQ